MRFLTPDWRGEQMRLPRIAGSGIPTGEPVGRRQAVKRWAKPRTNGRPEWTVGLALLARLLPRTPAGLPGRPARFAGVLPPDEQAANLRVPASASACGSPGNRCRAKDRETAI